MGYLLFDLIAVVDEILFYMKLWVYEYPYKIIILFADDDLNFLN
jgi:hypothetical protein